MVMSLHIKEYCGLQYKYNIVRANMFEDVQYKIQWLNNHPDKETIERFQQAIPEKLAKYDLDLIYAVLRHHPFRECVQFLSVLTDFLKGQVSEEEILEVIHTSFFYWPQKERSLPGFFESVFIEVLCAYDQDQFVIDLGVGPTIANKLGNVAQSGAVPGFESFLQQVSINLKDSPWFLDDSRVSWILDQPKNVIPEIIKIALKEPHDLDEEQLEQLKFAQVLREFGSNLLLSPRAYNLTACYYVYHFPIRFDGIHKLHPCWQAACIKHMPESELHLLLDSKKPIHPLAMSQLTERTVTEQTFDYLATIFQESRATEIRLCSLKILASLPAPFQDRVQLVFKNAEKDPMQKVKEAVLGTGVLLEE